MKILRHQTIQPPTPSCHAATIALASTGLMAAWFGGAHEGARDCWIYAARNNGQGWGEPFLVASQEDMPHWNPVLYAQGEEVWLFYKAGVTIPGWHTRVMHSGDGGNTFSAPKELVPGDTGGRGPVKNKPLRLLDGRVLCPASVETLSRWDAFVDITDGGFSSFRRSALVPLDRGESTPLSANAFRFAGKGVIQPALWQTSDRQVHMLLRSTEGWMMRSDSMDRGETWCPAYATELPNNNSGLDVAQLRNGRLAVALNPISDRGARTPLCVYVSGDGIHFEHAVTLRDAPGEYSYPTLLADGDHLHVIYTVNRVGIGYAVLDANA